MPGLILGDLITIWLLDEDKICELTSPNKTVEIGVGKFEPYIVIVSPPLF